MVVGFWMPQHYHEQALISTGFISAEIFCAELAPRLVTVPLPDGGMALMTAVCFQNKFATAERSHNELAVPGPPRDYRYVERATPSGNAHGIGATAAICHTKRPLLW